MSLGEIIKHKRIEKGLKAYELADIIGRSTAVMSDIENGKLKGGISPEMLIRIADALDSPEILLIHCQRCPVRQHIMQTHYPELKNTQEPAVILAKMRQTMDEAIRTADTLNEKYRLADFKSDPDYRQTFTRALGQIMDVERVIEALKFELVLNQIHTQEELQQLTKQCQQKNIARRQQQSNREIL